MKPAEGARKPTTVDVIVTRDGQVFEGYYSRKGHPNFDNPLASSEPSVKNAYDSVPQSSRMSNTHGQCAEVSALSKAKAASADLNGAISMSAGRDGTLKEACNSLRNPLMISLKIINLSRMASFRMI